MRDSIRVGEAEVRPGQRATIDLPITDLSTHTPMTLPVQVIHGRKPGPTLFICAALHGDEISGVEIIRRLLKLSPLRRISGTLIAAPIVNVFGFVSLSRYLPDRRDLNRSFPGSTKGSLAARLANLFLTEVVAKASHGIDLHTGAVGRTNFPQIRANLNDERVERLARAFGVPIVINAGYRAGSLRHAASERYGVPVLVYEAGEALRFDELSIRAGVKGVTRMMRALGMISPGKPRKRNLEPLVVRSSTWVRAPVSGVFRASISQGTFVEKGDLLGLLSDPFGENETNVVAGAKGIVVGQSTLPVVHEGDALFHIGRFEGVQAAAETLDAFEPLGDYDKGMTAELAGEPQIV